MRRYSPPYRSPPRRGYYGRERSPPRRRGYGVGWYGGGRRDQNNGSLLVRNIPLTCRPEDLRAPFERFGPVRDVYIPKDYYSGEPRGFAFVQFVDPYDASEAQYHMNRQLFGGREITVVVAAESRKTPDEMRSRDRPSRSSGYERRRSSHHGRSRSRSVSQSRSPRHPAYTRRRSRSYSPVPRGQEEYSVSPRRRLSRSPVDHRPDRDVDERYSYSPENGGADAHKQVGNGFDRKSSYDVESGSQHKSPRRASVSPPGSRSRSADSSPGCSR